MTRAGVRSGCGHDGGSRAFRVDAKIASALRPTARTRRIDPGETRLPDESAGAAGCDEVGEVLVLGVRDKQHCQVGPEARELAADREAVVVSQTDVEQHGRRLVVLHSVKRRRGAARFGDNLVAARLEESPRSLPEARLVIDDHDLRTAGMTSAAGVRPLPSETSRGSRTTTTCVSARGRRAGTLAAVSFDASTTFQGRITEENGEGLVTCSRRAAVSRAGAGGAHAPFAD